MLADIRKQKGLSQSDLADRSGISVRTIQHYEQGDKDINKAAVETVYKLATALECSIEALINIEYKNKKPTS